MKILARWKDNWADEMDLEGFKVFSKSGWEKYFNQMMALKTELDFVVGSNEIITYEDGEDVLSNITYQEIDELEANNLKRIFKNKCGFFPLIESDGSGLTDQN